VSTEQLNIDFLNKGNFNNFLLHISTKLEPITNGIPLQEWIEIIGNKLYNESKGDSSHVILENYFPFTKVKSCNHNAELSVHARLINNNTSFTIELKDYGGRNDTRLQRFFIAHELAHTFFYNTQRNPFIDYRFFPAGSKEIEFLCNRISRSILMPNVLLYNKLNKIASPYDDNFSLDAINKLCSTFRVPYNVLLNRVIFDTGFWNCLFLRFRNYETEENNWKLRERYLPSIYWNNMRAFIPIEDQKKSKNNPNRYPSAKGKLKASFNSVYQELKTEKRLTKKFQYETIDASPLKNFLKYYFDKNKEIIVHFSLGKMKYSTIEYLNVCIPLPRAV
jgi:hypothetical protein